MAVDPDDLLTSAEAAVVLRGLGLDVSGETVRRWGIERKLAYVQLPSGARRFRRSAVEAVLVSVDPESAVGQ